MKIEPGSVVRLKSGGPEMVVLKVDEDGVVVGLVHDIVGRQWLCPRCRGVVITESHVASATSPEALSFLVAQAERRHKKEAHP